MRQKKLQRNSFIIGIAATVKILLLVVLYIVDFVLKQSEVIAMTNHVISKIGFALILLIAVNVGTLMFIANKQIR